MEAIYFFVDPYFVSTIVMSALVCIYIVGAQIIDLMMLVIDITKGIQTQTAEVTQTYVNYCACTVYICT